MKQLVEYFDRAYIINLEDRPDRRKQVVQEFRHLGIDIPNQKVRFYTAKRLTDKGSFPDAGVRGCFTSHRNILELAIEDKLRNVLIFEDDVSFRSVEASLVEQIIIQLGRTSWDIVFFGYLRPPDTGLAGPLADFSEGVMGMHFYAVNGNVLGPLFQFMKDCETRPTGHPDGGPMTADGALNHIRCLTPDMRVLLAVPSLAHQRSSRTDISPPRMFDQIDALRPLLRAVRTVKHKLRMEVDRRRLRRT